MAFRESFAEFLRLTKRPRDDSGNITYGKKDFLENLKLQQMNLSIWDEKAKPSVRKNTIGMYRSSLIIMHIKNFSQADMVRTLNKNGYPVKQSALSRYLKRNPITRNEMQIEESCQRELAQKENRQELNATKLEIETSLLPSK